MKIAQDVRTLYSQREPTFRRLATDVEGWLRSRVERNEWFYRGRVKQLESFALKLETGRISQPEICEDFFGCTLIVRTSAEIMDAEELITSRYHLVERRPSDDGTTYKASSSFVFDDLRLYVQQPSSSTGRNQDLDGLLFEVQIKTILQEAWSVATHDLIYKSDSVSWPRERIAFQVKAMLEHAEIAISEAHNLASARSLAKQDRGTTEIVQTIDVITSVWPADQLPRDRKRLAENVAGLMRLCAKGAKNLKEIIDAERTRIGLIPSNLSPYAFIVQALANNNEISLQKALEHPRNRRSIFIHAGMDLPSWMENDHPKIVRV